MSGDALHDLNRHALDPAASAVVSACAGSGKTWLLVSRILRLLLEGAAPGEILAITYTRKKGAAVTPHVGGLMYDGTTMEPWCGGSNLHAVAFPYHIGQH